MLLYEGFTAVSLSNGAIGPPLSMGREGVGRDVQTIGYQGKLSEWKIILRGERMSFKCRS